MALTVEVRRVAIPLCFHGSFVPQKVDTVAACISFCRNNHLRFPLNGQILVSCIRGGRPYPQLRLTKDLCVLRVCVCFTQDFSIMDVQICCFSSRLFPPALKL